MGYEPPIDPGWRLIMPQDHAQLWRAIRKLSDERGVFSTADLRKAVPPIVRDETIALYMTRLKRGKFVANGVRTPEGEPAEAEGSYGYREDAPKPLIQTKGYINKRTGQIEQIPIGIDPGWHKNPGKFRSENLRQFLAERLESAPKPLRDAAIADTVNGWLFKRIQSGAFKGAASAPVAVLPEDAFAVLNTEARTVWFTTDSAKLQAKFKLGLDDYLKAQKLLDEGQIVRVGLSELKVLQEIDGQWWRVRMSVRQGETRLTELRRVSAAVAKSELSEAR
jgi:hypothetical protein